MERLQKILARGGVTSRRAAEELIVAGRVRVNGRIVTELGTKADPRKDRIEVDGKRVVAEQPVYVVLHKPRGVVSTMHDPEGRPTVKELLANVGARVYPVGRLDFATSGVLLATNDGAFSDGLLHPRKLAPKTYVVKVNGVMTPEDLERWRQGVPLEDGMTLPADARLLRHESGKTWFELTIREGRNQQIRRMGEATGFPVMRLARLAFADISSEGLAPGRWRHLTRDELVALKKTYGVPRSVAAGVAAKAKAERSLPAARRGATGRAQRALGREAPPPGAPPARRASRAAADEERSSRRGAGGDERAAKAPRRGPPVTGRDERAAEAPPRRGPRAVSEEERAQGRRGARGKAEPPPREGRGRPRAGGGGQGASEGPGRGRPRASGASGAPAKGRRGR